jgi:uncharacterized RDD family membrane protein YckC
MKPRFEPHSEITGNAPPSELMDSESLDATEQQFAASLEAKPAERRFVANDVERGNQSARLANNLAEEDSSSEEMTQPVDIAPASTQSGASFDTNVPPGGDSWREELAAKMKLYRAHRRPRGPHYPSLQLKFEALESGATARALPTKDDAAALVEQRLADPTQDVLEPYQEPSEREDSFAAVAVPSGKILEFPAPLVPPPPSIDELAEPILEHPRILEVPDVMPPPPALGGILIEPGEPPSRERRQGFELPLIAAPFSMRILAGGIDALIVVAAFALFAYTFLSVTSVLLPVRQAAGMAAGLLAVLWAGYQYLMLVYSGSTPGLKLAKLHLSRFDGTPVPLQLRRWRVLASLLSGLSLGLGYAWCFLDEDQLCWHDRITHTYMAPTTPE